MLGPGQGGGRVRLIFVCRVRGRMVSETFDLEENATFKGKTFPIGWRGGGRGLWSRPGLDMYVNAVHLQ